jgi:hypothetical protein
MQTTYSYCHRRYSATTQSLSVAIFYRGQKRALMYSHHLLITPLMVLLKGLLAELHLINYF